MAEETVPNRTATFENGRWVYRRGFLNGANGYQVERAADRLGLLIPQLSALMVVAADEEFIWSDEIRQQLLFLAQDLANEVHENWEENSLDQRNAKLDELVATRRAEKQAA